jgi:hypothetical protein
MRTNSHIDPGLLSRYSDMSRPGRREFDNVQIGSGAHPISDQMGAGGCFTGG